MGAVLSWTPHHVQVDNYILKVYDFRPDQLKTPIPLVIAPGWLEVPESHGHVISHLVGQGRRVIMYDAPHGLPFPIDFSRKGEHKVELEKMKTLVSVLRGMGILEVDLMGRSEGAVFVLLVARYYPELVRNVVLENPAGIIGKDWFLPFFIRWLGDQKQTLFNETGDPPPYAPVPAGQVFNRNRWRAIKALWAIMHSDMRMALRDIKREGKKIAVIYTDSDKLFPERRIRSATWGIVDLLEPLSGSHTSYFSDPERFGKSIDKALSSLEHVRRI